MVYRSQWFANKSPFSWCGLKFLFLCIKMCWLHENIFCMNGPSILNYSDVSEDCLTFINIYHLTSISQSFCQEWAQDHFQIPAKLSVLFSLWVALAELCCLSMIPHWKLDFKIWLLDNTKSILRCTLLIPHSINFLS